MKKTLAAVAVLGAFAGSALAADVTLYGVIDTGLNWTQTKSTGYSATDKFSMASGQDSGARWGLRGTEDLGNGYKVGFNLESSFKGDDGSMETRLFHREALLYVQSDFGELSMGRTGALDAGTGRYGLMAGNATAMGTGMDTVGKSTKVLLGTGDRMDNTITYKTPTFAGITGFAQASLKMNSSVAETTYPEGSSDAQRYYALGATYSADGLNAGLVFSTSDYSRIDVNKNAKNDDNGYVVSGFVNYDFGMIKPMLAAQYWDSGLVSEWKKANGGDVTSYSLSNTKGYGVVVGATAPVLGGLLKVTGGWNDYESIEQTVDVDGNNWMFGVGYEYSLSKRTMVYTAAGYTEEKFKTAGETYKNKTSEVMLGLVHKF